MKTDPVKSFVQLEGLTRVYREGGRERPVLNAVSGAVFRGEAVALLGRSGSGKSTLLNLIGGIDLPNQGRVLIGGKEITALDEQSRTLFRRRHIGFVYQFFNLIPTLTTEENLLLPLELNGCDPQQSRERVNKLLDAVMLSDRADSFPDQLSGGEQQRIAVARALVHEPDLVLADEPTGNLDAESGQQVLALLYELVSTEQRTLITVTHSQAVAARADRILTLQHGALVEALDKVLW